MLNEKTLDYIVTDYRLLLGVVTSEIYRKQLNKLRKVASIGLQKGD